jgi:hypothetical protein
VVAPATGVAATPKFDALLKGLKDQNLHLGLVKDGFRDYVEQLKEVEAVAASVGRALTPTEKSEIQDEIINRQELGRVIRQNAADQSRANTHAASAAGIVTNSFKSAIIEGKKFKDVLKNLAAQLIEVALQKFILDRIQSSLFGFFGGFIPGFANGTHSAPGGLAVVGERGPELVNLPRGSQVTPNHRLGMGGDGGSNTTVQIINNSGAEASVERSNGPNGDELVKIFIGAAAENIASGGALSGAIQGSFGMHRQGAFG